MATHNLKKLLLLFFIMLFLVISICVNAQNNNFCIDCHNSHFADIADCITCHRGIPETRRKDLAHQKLIKGKYAKFLLDEFPDKRRGIDLINDSGCRRCHSIGGKGNVLSVSLDSSIENLTVEEIALAIEKPNEFMPDFNFTSEQITYIINGLLYLSFVNKDASKDFTQVVHLGSKKSNTFSKKCGNCHKMISSLRGPVGSGYVAPNLSGLFSPYYPREIDGKKWDSKLLEKWLKNPRQLSSNALMPVLELSGGEFTEIEETFGE